MNNSRSKVMEAEYLTDVERYAEAVPVLKQAIVEDPESSRPHSLLSLSYYHLTLYKDALDATMDALAKDPEDELAYRIRALSLSELKRRREAVEAAREAVRLRPELPDALHVLAVCLAEVGQRQEARQIADEMVRLAPDQSLSYLTQGLISMSEKNWVDSEQQFRKALAIEPESWLVMNNLGVVLKAQGKKKEAIDVLHNAARLNPSAEIPRRNLRDAVGAYASISFGLIYVFARILQMVVRSTSPQYKTAAVSIGVLLFVSVVGAYIYTRRRRMSELHDNVQLFYEVETRQLKKESKQRIGIGVLVSVTAIALLIFTIFVIANFMPGAVVNVPVLVIYGLLWCGMIAEIVWLVRSKQSTK